MAESQATERVRDARAALLLTHPFFGVLSLKLALIENAGIKTMRVGNVALEFNPDFVREISQAELKGVIAHEVMHLGLAHHARQGARDIGTWQEACDHAINPNLLKDGFTLPKGALSDPRFADQSAESIYQTLMDEKPQQPPEQPKGGQGAGAGADQPGAGQPGAPDPNASGQPQQGQGEPQPGAGADATGDFTGAGPEGSAEAREAEREWRENANEALRAAASAGKMPAGIRRQVENACTPKADWRALLRRFMTDQVKQRSTWSKRNKRFPDVYLPGRTKDGMGAMVVGVDTSGSISAATLARFSAEISAICADVEPSEIRIVYCDARVNRVDTFEPGDEIRLQACGGGGTRFQPVFDYVESEGLQPAALVYLTDLAGDEPRDPGYPTLWATYGARGAQGRFGETVAID